MLQLFNSIEGLVTAVIPGTGNSQICIENQGIEWILDCSRLSIGQVPPLGSPMRLFTFLVHREDQMYLCGFASIEERALFLELIKVEGIGPRQALKILSGSSVRTLKTMISSSDVDGLETIPGLGKKTAQKLILALSGKLALDTEGPSTASTSLGSESNQHAELLQALIEMGYDRKSVIEQIQRIAPQLQGLGVTELEKELFVRIIRALA